MKDKQPKMKKDSALKNLSFDGVLMISLGLILLIWPERTMNAVFMAFGGVIALLGLVKCLLFFKAEAAARSASDLTVGVLQLALGIFMLAASGFFVGIFYLAVGAIVAFGCILMAIQLFRLYRVDPFRFYAALVFGAVLLVLTVLVLVNPASFGNFAFRLQGIALIVEGLSMILVMSGSKK